MNKKKSINVKFLDLLFLFLEYFIYFILVTLTSKYEYNNIKYNFIVMKRLALIIALIFVGLYLNAMEDNCTQISNNWKTEKEAISRIETTTFKTSESVRPDETSWMTSAHFYSCDDEFGYLIIKSNKKTFIHQDVPKSVWIALRDARSNGGFYNFYIKNKFKLDKNGAKSPVL